MSMIYDPTDTRVAMDHHGHLLMSRITGRDEQGHVIVEWVPTVRMDFRGQITDGENFTHPSW